MKKSLMTAMMVAGLTVSLGVAAEVEVGADVASAYVFRGATFNDGAVLQPYVNVGGLPISFGVWGNLDIDDYDNTLDDGEFSEIDLTASYDLPLDLDPVGVSVGYTEYLYPNAEASADREVGVSFALDKLLSPSLGVFYGVDGGIKDSLHVELGIEHPLLKNDTVSIDFSTSVAYEDPDEGKAGFSYYTAGVSVGYGILSAGVTYVGQIDDDVLVDVEKGGLYDTDVYGTLGVSTTF